MVNVVHRPAIRSLGLAVAAVLTVGAVAATAPASAAGRPAPPAPSTSTGFGGAVSSVDAEASAAGLEVLRKGGNAADAAVATAAALGVPEPYSAGIGGGGYFVYFDAAPGEVPTIDGREPAPAAMPSDAFVVPGTVTPATPFGQAVPFADAVSSGLSVGVPGTLATWEAALDEFGTESLKEMLKPAILLATRGFKVDETFAQQTAANQDRFEEFPATAELFLPNGEPPAVGSTFKNPDLAKTLREIALRGTDAFYEGAIANEIAAIVQDPQTIDGTDLPAFPGFMTADDVGDYEVILQDPTHIEYRGLDVYGMAPSSSGGTTVGESLNILENFDLGAETAEQTVQSLHLYLEATAHAFADRGAYVGDPAFVDVPTETLLSQEFADARACAIDPDAASVKPVAPAPLDAAGCDVAALEEFADTENVSTTHLSVVDRWGNAVAYTLTIEQTGGSGITVPGRGFLLNNELTDFSFLPNPADPNIVEPGKRPRSSMSPTIVLDDGEVRYVVGSPGGSMIITTVTQVLMNRIDLGMTLAEAVAAPRASQRNTTAVAAEQAFRDAYEPALAGYGHTFTTSAEIGAVAAIEVDENGLMTAVAEPVRRGGGTGLVVKPAR
ncbi:gamma-glutamyltransferase [Agromyces sp. Marseille-P2726]|uniref:gamma-glutamyltransferase n=1 Tax=Agromyces sp. Marseille-P2726 TaxID=2709132 RepID=UPI001570D3B4|nr:gamma-glutamyltransferase [Agromyces sp. Marseille-P2726]